MKIKIAVIFILYILLVASSCNFSDETETAHIPELKISAYVLDKTTADYMQYDTARISFELLEPGVVRILAPTTGTAMNNLQLFFEFDGGTIDVISKDSDVQISIGERAQAWNYDSFSDRMFGYTAHLNYRGYTALFPIGGKIGYVHFDDILYGMDNQKYVEGYTGREYYITVHACIPPDDESPVITAQLKLVQLEDAGTKNETDSRFYSIELISYEMSETYAMELAS